MTLVERQVQMDQLLALLTSAGRGRGRIAALTGEAGIGKSALALAFAEAAANEARVLWSACEDLETAEPLGPLRDLARSAKWDMPKALDAPGGRLHAFSEGLEVFNSGPKTTLIVIEDLHWADDATLDFVRFLGRRIHTTRILLLVTARSDEFRGQNNLRRALTDILPDNLVRIDVPLLTEEAVIGLAMRKGMNGKALYKASAGNAFFVMELLRAGRGEALPATVRDAVQVRADRLSAGARRVLDAISIFPRRTETFLIAALCDEDYLTALDECVAQGMLNAVDDTYAFRHEIARHSIETLLTEVRRRELNTQALAALRPRDGVAVARLVHHAHQAQDSKAVRTLAPIAGDEASRLGAHREAADYFGIALSHSDTMTVDERIALHSKYAFECQLVSLLDEAIAAQRKAVQLLRERGDGLREGSGLISLARFIYLTGNRIAAEGYARDAVSLLERLPPGPELTMAYSTISEFAMLADQTDEALEYGNKAVALAEPGALNRPEILCHALTNLGAVQWRDPDLARSFLDRGLAIALANDFPDHAARGYCNRACLEVYRFNNRRAEQLLNAGIAYCIERDLDTWTGYMRGFLALVQLRLGRSGAAIETARLVMANERATSFMRFPALVTLTRLRTRCGEPAAELLEDLSQFLQTAMETQRIVPYAVLMAERAWLGQADREEALGQLAKAEAMAFEPVMASEVYYWQHMLGADRTAIKAGGLLEPFRLLLSGNWQVAADAWLGLGAPYEQALALLEGDHRAQLQALSIFESLGATAVAGHVRTVIRQRGERVISLGPRASTRANPAGLTKRQMDVLRLIDQGHSNAEIAEQLFISPKTVDHHIQAILGKLDAKSRGDASAKARSAGLIGG